jgi:Methyl-accepting chemotaxis protein
LKPFSAFQSISGHAENVPFEFKGDSTLRHASLALANGGRWHILAHMTDADAMHSYRVARASLIGGVLVMLVLILGSLVMISQFIHRRITGPAQQLVEAAEAVAAGDLSTKIVHSGADDEIGRLSRAVRAMIEELRRLAGALTDSAQETASMTAEINASSEEMAASAGQIAHTAADLSQQAHVMAETIQTLAGSSEHLVGVAADLDAGAREGVERNNHLRELALENRARLDDSSRSLETLNADVEANVAAIEQLAEASEEVRTFVTLVQKLARQSKLLALNAAMEAARAGDHGHGFAVVAEEVRRLAAMSSDAAERTERVVSGVLNAIAESRISSERTVDTVRSVRGATQEGSRSFGQIEQAVAEADGWTASIQRAAMSTNGLSQDLRSKLDSLATGTETFAAAMQEVAASSEEQSASTEQIAAAAGTLAGAAERLGKLVSNLRIEQKTSTDTTDSHRTVAPVRLPPEVALASR